MLGCEGELEAARGLLGEPGFWSPWSPAGQCNRIRTNNGDSNMADAELISALYTMLEDKMLDIRKLVGPMLFLRPGR
jgi:hypothetical protein